MVIFNPIPYLKKSDTKMIVKKYNTELNKLNSKILIVMNLPRC